MIPAFAIRLICGLSAVWVVSPRKLITSGFFRIQMLITLGLSVLLILTASQWEAISPSDLPAWSASMLGRLGTLASLLAVLSFLGSVFWTLERRRGGMVFGGLIAGISTTTVLLTAPAASLPTSPVWLSMLDHLTAAWLIGSVTGTMLLGHWYLTATGMSLTPLLQLTRVFLGCTLLRSLSTGLLMSGLAGELGGSGFYWILRWAGLVGPLVLAVMTLQILRYRNTQSATGVLYAATILVYMGEMAASLMLMQTSLSHTV